MGKMAKYQILNSGYFSNGRITDKSYFLCISNFLKCAIISMVNKHFNVPIEVHQQVEK